VTEPTLKANERSAAAAPRFLPAGGDGPRRESAVSATGRGGRRQNKPIATVEIELDPVFEQTGT
jgi:hypothetical protein